MKKRVLIMGAGVAGLACGYELSNAGYHVTVVEKDNHVGGLASTLKKGNFLFDTGPHRWWTKNDEIDRWFKKLLQNELVTVPRYTRIYFDKKFFHYPIKLNIIKSITLFQAINVITQYLYVFVNNIFRQKEIITIEDGYINKFGRGLYEMFFRRYTEKLWGRKCSELSSDWIDQRTRGFNAWSTVKEILNINPGVVSFVDEFSYPKKGIGRISELLAKGIAIKGGKILLNTTVKTLRRKKNKLMSLSVVQSGKVKTLDFDEFVSSIPLPYLTKCLSPVAPKNIIKAAQTLKFRAAILVVLFMKKTHLTKDNWVYVHPVEIPFVRMMEMDNWSESMQTNGTTSYVFEVTCEFNDEIWNMTEPKISKIVKNAFIQEFNFISEADVIGSCVCRIENYLPVYNVGYLQPLSTIKDYLKNFKNLQIIGRNGTFRYNNADHSIEMGLYAARNIIKNDKNAFNIESVNIEREYLEEK